MLCFSLQLRQKKPLLVYIYIHATCIPKAKQAQIERTGPLTFHNPLSRAQDPMFDPGMMDDIRSLVHPLYSPIPTFPVTTDSLCVDTKDDLRKRIKITTAVDPKAPAAPRIASAGFCSYLNLRHLEEERANVKSLPVPKITYAHGGGCIYSNTPDVVLKSAEAVAAMDGFAREKLVNITALLDAGVDYESGPGSDLEEALKACMKSNSDDEEDEDDEDDDDEAAADQESEANPKSKPKSKPIKPPSMPDIHLNGVEVFNASQELTQRLINNFAESEARARMRTEKTRLEEALKTSALVKGMYFKRCNGQYVSALGDILEFEGQKEAGDEASENGARTSEDEGEDAASASASTTTPTSTAIFNQDVLSSAFTEDSTPPSLASSPLLVSHSPSLSTSAFSLPPTKPATTPVDTRIGFGYAVLNLHEQSSASALTTYPTPLLQNRELLVAVGAVRFEDLAHSSWGFHRVRMH